MLGTRTDKDGNIITEFGFGDSKRIKISNFMPEDLIYIRRHTLGGWAQKNEKRFLGEMESAIEYDKRAREDSLETPEQDYTST